MTPKQFDYALKDWQRDKDLEREFVFAGADVNVINATKTPKGLIGLPWDKKVELREITEDDWHKWDNLYKN